MDFGPVAPCFKVSVKGTHPVIHYVSKRYPGNPTLTFEFKRNLTTNNGESYRCRLCSSKRKRDHTLGTVPVITIENGRFKIDPDYPLNDHFCQNKSDAKEKTSPVPQPTNGSTKKRSRKELIPAKISVDAADAVGNVNGFQNSDEPDTLNDFNMREKLNADETMDTQESFQCNSSLSSEVESIKQDLTYLTHQVHRILLALHVPLCACETCVPRNEQHNNVVLSAARPASPFDEHQRHGERMAEPVNGFAELFRADAAIVREEDVGIECSPVSQSQDSSGDDGEVKLNVGADLATGPMVFGGPSRVQTHDPWSAVPPAPPSYRPIAPRPPLISDGIERIGELQRPLDRDDHGYQYQLQGQRPLDRDEHGYQYQRHYYQMARRAAPIRFRGSTRGRRSKYCTAAEKAAVANYAAIYGATAAARRFGIPPPVASYYHRKLSNSTLPRGRRPHLSEFGTGDENGSFDSSLGNGGLRDSELDHLTPDTDNLPTMVNGELCEISPSKLPLSRVASYDERFFYGGASPLGGDFDPNISGGDFLGGANGNLRPVASPGTGKGRGRPKLIGDDLDAELLDYLLEHRWSNPNQRLNADSVMALATRFIRQKSPGLLDVEGGRVSLKPTWGMRLMVRVNTAFKARLYAEAKHQATSQVQQSGIAKNEEEPLNQVNESENRNTGNETGVMGENSEEVNGNAENATEEIENGETVNEEANDGTGATIVSDLVP